MNKRLREELATQSLYTQAARTSPKNLLRSTWYSKSVCASMTTAHSCSVLYIVDFLRLTRVFLSHRDPVNLRSRLSASADAQPLALRPGQLHYYPHHELLFEVCISDHTIARKRKVSREEYLEKLLLRGMKAVCSTSKTQKRVPVRRAMSDTVASPSKRRRRQESKRKQKDGIPSNSTSTENFPTASSSVDSNIQPEPEPEHETIEQDDTCPICHLLFTRPVRTRCNHILCEPCMAHWADVSISTQTTRISLDEPECESTHVSPNEIETKCPMCRTLTIARPDHVLEAELRQKYPQSYTTRDAESESDTSENNNHIENLTLLIGNEHRLLPDPNPDLPPPRHDDGSNHEWKFFIRPSPATTDLIEEVHIFLHPTFRSPRVIVQYPPYEIRRTGWGTFTIEFNIILRAGYSWVSTQAEDTVDGGYKGKLPLEWRLDFSGRGSQMRMRLKVRREKGGVENEEAEKRVREQLGRAWTAQRRGDPDYVPPCDLLELPGLG